MTFFISDFNEIEDIVKLSFEDIRKSTTRLSLSGSGFSISHVQRLDINLVNRSGSRGSSNSGVSKKIFGRFNGYGILDITDDSNMCLKNSILYHLSHEDIFEKSTLSNYDDKISNGNIYRQYDYKINDTNVQYPAGFDDLRTLEQNNPLLNLNFIVWKQKNNDFYKTYETNITNKLIPPTNIYLVLGQYIHNSTLEIAHHFYPISNINLFHSKLYIRSMAKASYSHHSCCPYCAKKFSKVSL